MTCRPPLAPFAAAPLVLGLLAAAAPAAPPASNGAAPAKGEAKVRARAFLATDKLPAGGTTEVAVVLDVKAGWHVNSNPAHSRYAVPTAVTVKTARGTEIGAFAFPTRPPAVPGGERRPVKELSGRVVLRAPVTVPVGAAGGKERLTVSVKYQACDATRCLRPKTLTFGGTLPVAAPGAPVRPANAKWFGPESGDAATATRTAER